MAFEKKSQDPWDRKPETRKAPPVPAPETSKPPESKKGPLGSLRAWNERRRAEKEEARRLPPESCPWCGQEMEQGYLYTGRDKIYWSPSGPDFSTIFFRRYSRRRDSDQRPGTVGRLQDLLALPELQKNGLRYAGGRFFHYRD